MICICILSVVTLSYAKEWRGIVPLHSTREDVKRLLGRSAQPGERFYEFENEVAVIQYSSGPCGKYLPSGWNVPPDTVISIGVTPKSRLQLTDLNVDLRRYKKSVDPKIVQIFYYNDEEDGVTLQVSHDQVTRIFYEPAAKDKHLRCPANSPVAPTQQRLKTDLPDKIDEFGNIPLKEEQERLNHLAHLLRELPDTQGYLIAYAGRRARAREARSWAECAKNYLVNERGIEARRIVTIDGGHREEFTIDLFLVPRGAAGPTPTPTVDPREVQIVKVSGAKSNICRSTRPRRNQR